MQHRLSVSPSFHALAFAIALALPSMAHAEIAADATDLDEIVVTGTRTDVAIEDSLVPAQVIDREEIERTPGALVAGTAERPRGPRTSPTRAGRAS